MKKILLILAVMLCIITLTACKPKKDSILVNIPELSDEELESLDTEITFWHILTGENIDVLDTLITKFNQTYPNIKITHESLGGYTNLRKKTVQSVVANNNPTMVMAYPDHTAIYDESEFILPLTKYIEHSQVGLSDSELSDFMSGYFADDVQNSLPFVKWTEVLFANMDLLNKYGITLSNTPTWEEIDAIAEKAVEDGKVGLNWDSESNVFIVLAEQWGGKYTSSEESNHYQFDNDKTKEAINYFTSRAIETNGNITKFATPAKWSEQYGSAAFLAEEVAMLIGLSGGARYNDPAVNDKDFEMKVYPMPQKDVNNPKAIQRVTNLNILSSNTSDEQRLGAWLFSKYLTSTEANATLAAKQGYLPATSSAYESDIYQEFINTTDPKLVAQAAACKVGYEQRDAHFHSPAFVGSLNARTEVSAIISNVTYAGKTLEDEIKRALNELNQ